MSSFKPCLKLKQNRRCNTEDKIRGQPKRFRDFEEADTSERQVKRSKQEESPHDYSIKGHQG